MNVKVTDFLWAKAKVEVMSALFINDMKNVSRIELYHYKKVKTLDDKHFASMEMKKSSISHFLL